MEGLMPGRCAVRRHGDGTGVVGRCWKAVVDGRCPVHGDVAGVQYRFKTTGVLTNDYDLERQRLRNRPLATGTSVQFGSQAWLERFALANPRAELVGFRGRRPLVKFKRSVEDSPRILQVIGGTPERPEYEDY